MKIRNLSHVKEFRLRRGRRLPSVPTSNRTLLSSLPYDHSISLLHSNVITWTKEVVVTGVDWAAADTSEDILVGWFNLITQEWTGPPPIHLKISWCREGTQPSPLLSAYPPPSEVIRYLLSPQPTKWRNSTIELNKQRPAAIGILSPRELPATSLPSGYKLQLYSRTVVPYIINIPPKRTLIWIKALPYHMNARTLALLSDSSQICERNNILLALLSDNSQICGASAMSEVWALTAAHCVFNGDELTAPTSLSLRSGSVKHAEDGYIHDVTKIIPHHKYHSMQYDEDIAVLKVKQPFSINKLIGYVSLPLQGEPVEVGTKTVVIGWGLTEEGSGSDLLKETTVDVVDEQICEEFPQFRGIQYISKNMICAVTEGTDSAPLVANETTRTWSDGRADHWDIGRRARRPGRLACG
uniref:Peptidase S1 domain-containing protein n=1 Tax=Timema bartmani TaxID=61472 RepID=A0A7R9ES31_9NEOP|nr:unnamed protein product [Timema bartmani]